MFLLRFLLLALSVAVLSSDAKRGSTGTTEGTTQGSTTGPSTTGNSDSTTAKPTTKARSPPTTKKTQATVPGGGPYHNGGPGTRNNNGTKYSAVSGWSIWALFWGFLAGMAVGAPISGGLLYACRRSVYSVWYRGIFTRYQCDVADTEADNKIEDDKNAGDSAMMTLGTELDTKTKIMNTTGDGTTGAGTTGTTATGTMTDATATQTGATESKTKTPQREETGDAATGGAGSTKDKLKTDD